MWIFCIIILVVIGAALMVYSFTSDGWQGGAGILCQWCFFIAIILVDVNTSEPTPTPLDVYRGNTELEITSVNGVPTDTVVVFKNK